MKNQSFDALRESEEDRTGATVRTLLGYLWPKGRLDLRARVVIAIFSLLLAKVLNTYVPFLLRDSINALTLPQNVLVLPLGLILAYGLARILHQFFAEFRDFIFFRVSVHAQRVIALKTFRHLHALSLNFHLSRQTGGLTRVIERGVKGIQFVLGFMVFNILPTILEILIVTIVLLSIFPPAFALITFLTIAIYIAYTLSITEWRTQYRKTMNQTDSEANNKAVDSLLNYETVKYFGNEEHEARRYDSSLATYEHASARSQSSLNLLNFGQGVIIGLGLISVMILAGRGVVGGTMTIGDFVLVNTFLIQLYMPLNFLGFAYREIKQGLVDMQKMFELIEVDSEVRDAPDARTLRISGGELVFDHVEFGYSSERKILKDVSFRIPPGKTIAVVGPSGAGKSTLSRLLFRFWDVNGGSISIDGQDIRTLTQASLRAAIGIVPQDTVLFNDSIGYNIRYGRPNATDTEVEQAARLARIHDFVMTLPKRYDTPVGERGLKLSGGEKQRVAIARTLLKNPALLLFDEATSALDSATEKEIQSSLREVSRNRTTLVIAHRLSTVIDADEILVLRDGGIVERGRHPDLLAKGAEYADLWKRQQEAKDSILTH